jgi:hypothetical protein
MLCQALQNCGGNSGEQAWSENFDLQIPLLHMKAENQREKEKNVILE